jgi:hypothetical protein
VPDLAVFVGAETGCGGAAPIAMTTSTTKREVAYFRVRSKGTEAHRIA